VLSIIVMFLAAVRVFAIPTKVAASALKLSEPANTIVAAASRVNIDLRTGLLLVSDACTESFTLFCPLGHATIGRKAYSPQGASGWKF